MSYHSISGEVYIHSYGPIVDGPSLNNPLQTQGRSGGSKALSLKKGSSVAINQKSRTLASAGACAVCVLVSKLLTCVGRRGTNRSGVGGIIVRDNFFPLLIQ